MTQYNNFTVDFPKRLAELDEKFRPIASQADLDVSYAVMRLAAAFLLPYERLLGTSGAQAADVNVEEAQRIRPVLELDKRFGHSSYSNGPRDWHLLNVDNFLRGPRWWRTGAQPLSLPVHDVLTIIRHSVAHSNLFFGGENIIEHIFLGSRREKGDNERHFRVIQCTVPGLNHLIDAWIRKLQELQVNPALIWRELEPAA